MQVFGWWSEKENCYNKQVFREQNNCSFFSHCLLLVLLLVTVQKSKFDTLGLHSKLLFSVASRVTTSEWKGKVRRQQTKKKVRSFALLIIEHCQQQNTFWKTIYSFVHSFIFSCVFRLRVRGVLEQIPAVNRLAVMVHPGRVITHKVQTTIQFRVTEETSFLEYPERSHAGRALNSTQKDPRPANEPAMVWLFGDSANHCCTVSPYNYNTNYQYYRLRSVIVQWLLILFSY